MNLDSQCLADLNTFIIRSVNKYEKVKVTLILSGLGDAEILLSEAWEWRKWDVNLEIQAEQTGETR